MGWNCFKGENKKEAEGKAPLGERIAETLQNRFPRLYRLIKRIKENGAPSKIKLRRRRKINSVTPVASPKFSRHQEGKVPESVPAKANDRVTMAAIEDGSSQDASDVEKVVIGHGKVTAINDLPAPVGWAQKGATCLSKESVVSSSDSVQIKSLVDSVITTTLEESGSTSSTSDGDKASGCFMTELDNDNALGTTEEAALASGSNVGRTEVSPTPSSDDMKGVSSAKLVKGVTSPDLEQVSCFVNSVIVNAVDEVGGSLSGSARDDGASLHLGGHRQGHTFNETVWQVIDMDDEDNVIGVTEESKVVYWKKAGTDDNAGDLDVVAYKSAEPDSSGSVDMHQETEEQGDDLVNILPGPQDTQSDPLMLNKEVLVKDKLKVKSVEGTMMDANSKSAEVQPFTEEGTSFKTSVRPTSPSGRRNAGVKSADCVDIGGQNKNCIDREIPPAANLDTEKDSVRQDGIQGAGDEENKYAEALVSLCDGGDVVKSDGREVNYFVTSVVRDVVNSAVFQAEAKKKTDFKSETEGVGAEEIVDTVKDWKLA